MITVRHARRPDRAGLVEIATLAHRESTYRDLPFEPARVGTQIDRYLERPNRFALLIAETPGPEAMLLVGVLAGRLEPYAFHDAYVAVDTFVYVLRSHRGTTAGRRLVTTFEQWARTRDAWEVCMAVSTGITPERTARWYARLGFDSSGTIHKRRLR